MNKQHFYYLILGYDLIQGNPHGDPYLQIDPGFRAPAAKLEWEENWLTRDNSYNAPKGGWAYPEKSCYQSSSADEITSSADLQNSMSSVFIYFIFHLNFFSFSLTGFLFIPLI